MIFEFLPLANSRNGEGVEGQWQGLFSLSIERIDGKTLRLNAVVVNSIWVTVTEEDGKFVSGEVWSTFVAQSPEEQKLEMRVLKMLGNITGLRREGDTLKLESFRDTEIFIPAPQQNPAD